MEEPKTPPDENARLAALKGLNILDTPPEERFDRITRIAQRVLGVSIALVSLVDVNRQWFKSCQGLEGVTETSRAVSFCGHALFSDELFIIPDAVEDQRFFDNPLVTGYPHVRFYAGCPIRAPGGRRVGTLCAIDSKPREMTRDDRMLLRDLGALVEAELKADSIAVVEKRLRAALTEAERRASRDGLTKLWNKKTITDLISRELERSRRNELPMAVLIADLDHFKAVNDTHGHVVGDQVLVEVARIIRASLRSYDMVGRAGGEEFLVLLPECGPEEAKAVAQRMVTTMADSPLKTSAGTLSVTISGGLFTGDGAVGLPEKPEAVVELADKALYAAKRGGRNRVEVAARA